MSGSVLVVEDDPAIRSLLATVLIQEGHEVRTAVDGREALRLLRDGAPPSLILLDLLMPTMDGWEFRREQLRDPALAGVPVAVLTGALLSEEEKGVLKAVAYLGKPCRIGQVVQVVNDYAS